MRPHDTTMPDQLTDEDLAKIILRETCGYTERAVEEFYWPRFPDLRPPYLQAARAVRAALEGNGLAGQWVAWRFDASHHGIVLEHDHTRNAVKIAHNGDSAATYWLAADQVYAVEEARDGR